MFFAGNGLDANPGQVITYRITAVDGVENGASVLEIVTVPGPSAKGGGGGSGCFIATAAFGSADETPVLTLRTYRDAFLLERSWGRAFVRAYYTVSPPLARIIEGNPVLRAFVRMLLKPVNEAASGSLGQTWFPAALAMFIIWLTFSMVIFSVACSLRVLVGWGYRRGNNSDETIARINRY